MNLLEPANLPSRKAPLVMGDRRGASVARCWWWRRWCDSRSTVGSPPQAGGTPQWLHGIAAAVTVVGFVVFAGVVPLWRYRVHRWDIGPRAVYTRSGWLIQERRIAPISRVQTVDTLHEPGG